MPVSSSAVVAVALVVSSLIPAIGSSAPPARQAAAEAPSGRSSPPPAGPWVHVEAMADPEDRLIAAEAAVWVLDELVLLHDTGALRPTGEVDAIVDWVDDRVEDAVEARAVLAEVDRANAEDLEQLLAEGWEPPRPAVRRALAPLEAEIWSRLEAGETEFLPAGLHLRAVVELLQAAGAPPTPDGAWEVWPILAVLDGLPVAGPAGLSRLAAEGIGASEIALDAASEDAVAEDAVAEDGGADEGTDDVAAGDAGAVTDPRDDGRAAAAAATEPADARRALGTDPLSVAVLGLGLLLVFGGMLLLRRRHQSAWRAQAVEAAVAAARHSIATMTPPDGGSPDSGANPAELVLAASRRMTAALDGAAIRRIALESAVELTGADEAAFVDGRHTAARWWRAIPSWAPAAPVQDAVIARALDTAQTACHLTRAADGGGPVRLGAAPVLVEGAVIGALVVVSRGAGEMCGDVRDRLELLTPAVGAALSAADVHLGAVTAAEIDELTQLRNRRRLDADLAALEDDVPVTFAMIDVDHFKHFNDANGHEAGDTALQLVAAAVAGAVRPLDTVYRYGGEEFSALIRGCDPDQARPIVERIADAVRSLDVPGGQAQPLGCVTVSVGVASSRDGAEDLVGRADRALYVAKERGRDRVVAHDDPPVDPGRVIAFPGR